ncbi:uncharacterized protein TrAtP1_000814 [Trichoderma atroviride]|uniref:uncharacterized protein n=1 Tax=Hypocrea atroviridis TaxID=63577 RepID=UPI00331A0313|nr:hypothetical protein TrAtP1_000814 [Trichoderma atroviride]
MRPSVSHQRSTRAFSAKATIAIPGTPAHSGVQLPSWRTAILRAKKRPILRFEPDDQQDLEEYIGVKAFYICGEDQGWAI